MEIFFPKVRGENEEYLQPVSRYIVHIQYIYDTPKNIQKMSRRFDSHVFCLCSTKTPSIGITAILLRCIFPHRQVHFEDIGIGAQVILVGSLFFRRDGRRLISLCLSTWWLNQPL